MRHDGHGCSGLPGVLPGRVCGGLEGQSGATGSWGLCVCNGTEQPPQMRVPGQPLATSHGFTPNDREEMSHGAALDHPPRPVPSLPDCIRVMRRGPVHAGHEPSVADGSSKAGSGSRAVLLPHVGQALSYRLF